MRRVFALLLVLVVFLVGCSNDVPDDDPDVLVVYYFHGPGCPSCDAQYEFMSDLESRFDGVEVRVFDVSFEADAALMERLALAYEERIITPPATFIGGESVVGFGSSETTGLLIDSIIERCLSRGCKNPSSVLRDYEN